MITCANSISCSPCESSMDYGKIQHASVGLGIALRVAIPMYGDPNLNSNKELIKCFKKLNVHT